MKRVKTITAKGEDEVLEVKIKLEKKNAYSDEFEKHWLGILDSLFLAVNNYYYVNGIVIK